MPDHETYNAVNLHSVLLGDPYCQFLTVCVCGYENCALWGKVCAHDDPVGNVRFVGNISFPHKEFE